jgi:hypothetical protein
MTERGIEHSGTRCIDTLRLVLAAYMTGHHAPPVLTEWVEWYLAHHCANCGACDDTEQLAGGLCYICLNTRAESEGQSNVTPSA